MSKRKRQSEKAQTKNIIDIGQQAGLTLMTDTSAVNITDWLPTQIPYLDDILGGGIPYGRVTEIFGKEQSGY